VRFELLKRIGRGRLERVEGSRSDHSHERLELGEGLFDRVEVGTVAAVEKLGTAGLNGLPDAGDLMGRQIVHNDDVARLQSWCQHPFDPGEEATLRSSARREAWARQSYQRQAAHESDGLPVTVRDCGAATFAYSRLLQRPPTKASIRTSICPVSIWATTSA